MKITRNPFRPSFKPWRWWLWVYQSAAGGYYVTVCGRGYHVRW